MSFIKKIVCLVCIFLAINIQAQQEIIGKWKTIDDTTGEARSIVDIYTKSGKIYGKIIKILKESDRKQLCTECKGSNYNKPVEGMVIINGLEKNGTEYKNGTILDPENGKVYTCKIWVDKDKPTLLNVRGYIAFLYRTQEWVRD